MFNLHDERLTHDVCNDQGVELIILQTKRKEPLNPQLERIEIKEEEPLSIDAVNILLNWVQTGFEYEYDDKVWGGDRAFFAEESLNYSYCDCKDRSNQCACGIHYDRHG